MVLRHVEVVPRLQRSCSICIGRDKEQGADRLIQKRYTTTIQVVNTSASTLSISREITKGTGNKVPIQIQSEIKDTSCQPPTI
jgi:hypothetical protein